MSDYRIRVLASAQDIDADAWNTLLAMQSQSTPFMNSRFLLALHDNGCATATTGWDSYWIVLEHNQCMVGACIVYLKSHSYGEYVFDWAWAQAYHRHGLEYYPKALVAVPFSPVPGARLLAVDDAARTALLAGVLEWCRQKQVSSLHLLFVSEADLAACRAHRLLLRQTVQFHWHNTEPGYASFEDFLACLTQEKRKKIRQERRKVHNAGVEFDTRKGKAITESDWNFFYRCYEKTYFEHGNPPYLNRAFFAQIAQTMPENWLMFIAHVHGVPVACSLIGIDPVRQRAFGRYWGSLQTIDCLHFEMCYYQPIAWCIEHGYRIFEGGAQGEHKMARALMPVTTHSAHWLSHPAFTDAVSAFLDREAQHQAAYLEHLADRSPYTKKNLKTSP
jgi:hypothetical protein